MKTHLPGAGERVYRACTDAKESALWFHPAADHTTIKRSGT